MVQSVLGKLIQREFGRERYCLYSDKLSKKESMDIFCDIYEILRQQPAEDLNRSLKELLESVQTSIRISRNFFGISIGTLAGVLLLLCFGLSTYVLCGALGLVGICYLYKLVEYMKNRYCDTDVKIVLIYKIALFHLLEENCLQK